MPTFKGVTVCVRNADSEALQEWGVQRMSYARTVSCYIQSQANMRFHLSLRPNLPYASEHYKPPWKEDTEMQSRNGKERASTTHPDFQLLASLYLDGRAKPERRAIVYLDPDHPEFHPPTGHVTLKTRWVEGRDGKLREHAWYFSEIGIESVFDKMSIVNSTHQNDPLPEDELLTALGAASLLPQSDNAREEKMKLGQIVIELKRVRVGETWLQKLHRPRHSEEDEEDVNMAGANKIAHTTSLGRGTEIGNNVPVIRFYPYLEDEGIFAKFQFFYRSEDQLRQFSFPGFPRSESSKTRSPTCVRDTLNKRTAFMPPLSIEAAKAKTGEGPKKIASSSQPRTRSAIDSDPDPRIPLLQPKDSDQSATNVKHTTSHEARKTSIDAPESAIDSIKNSNQTSFLLARSQNILHQNNNVLDETSTTSEVSRPASESDGLETWYRSAFAESDADDEHDSDIDDQPRSHDSSETRQGEDDDGGVSSNKDDEGLHPCLGQMQIGLGKKRARSLDSEELVNLFKSSRNHEDAAGTRGRRERAESEGLVLEDGRVPDIVISAPETRTESSKSRVLRDPPTSLNEQVSQPRSEITNDTEMVRHPALPLPKKSIRVLRKRLRQPQQLNKFLASGRTLKASDRAKAAIEGRLRSALGPLVPPALDVLRFQGGYERQHRSIGPRIRKYGVVMDECLEILGLRTAFEAL